MVQENIPGYDALGFRVGANDREKFEYLLKSLWELSTSYPGLKGESMG